LSGGFILFIDRGILKYWGISEKSAQIVDEAEAACKPYFSCIEQTEESNQYRILSAFQKNGIAQRHFAPTTGYGYGDEGRDALDRTFAQSFGAEDALVRPQIVSGTHALSLCLFGLLKPSQTLLCATGSPYDTLKSAIGISGSESNSLKEYGIRYKQIELQEGNIDCEEIANTIREDDTVHVVLIQRSRGYAWRDALSLNVIGNACKTIKEFRRDIIIVVDNCYGEFVETAEPVAAGADIIAGSLIKNPGGGLAPTGGYIAGKREFVEEISWRLTSPGIGREVGSYAGSYAPFFQGLFMAPHIVAQALKGAILFSKTFESLGYDVLPKPDAARYDVIQSIKLNDEDKLIRFCQAIQKAAPVDSTAVPEPWDMPGYQHKIIMAAGTFVQGASIELSADAPIKPPYIAYMQGALTYPHAKLAAMMAVDAVL
jgi:cystathionine beta-lyase family protein involved in aluminum resistance